MLNILSYLPTKRKQTGNGWISFNAVCCTHNGESPDKRGRGGMLLENEHDWVYHCFNCGYKARFVLGNPFTFKVKILLKWLGVSDSEIKQLRMDGLTHKHNGIISEDFENISTNISFKSVELPNEARPINKDDIKFVEYLKNRGLKYNQYNFMITPHGKFRNKNRIIIPYTNNGKNVGYTSRFLDNNIPKYLNEQQRGYIFGLDLQHEEWKYVIVMEGAMDAISINGTALLHNRISNEQAQQLKKLHREIIVVPDYDIAGLKLIDDALFNHFSVSIPKWGDGVNDVNDAIIKYGKVSVLLMIIDNKNDNSLKIKLSKRDLIMELNNH